MSAPVSSPVSSLVSVAIQRLPHGSDLPLPAYQTTLAAGVDLIAAVAADKSMTIAPGALAYEELPERDLDTGTTALRALITAIDAAA